MGTAADTVLDGLAPVLEAFPDTDGILHGLVEALMRPAQAVDDVVTDTDTHDAWQVIYDPDACPAAWLPWLGQHVGVHLSPFTSEARWRQLIAQSAEFYSGTVRAMIHDVQLTLVSRTSGPPTVDFQRHVGGSRWFDIVVIRENEIVDYNVTFAAVMRQKPAGVIRTLLTSNAPLIDQGTDLIDHVTATIDAATFDDITA